MVALLLVSATACHARVRGPVLSRADLEAQRLFETVLPRDKLSGACAYDADWAHGELPDYAIPKELKLPVTAGLVPPSTAGDFRAVLDPHHRLDANSFCTEIELKVFAAQKVLAFEKGLDASMHIDRERFCFPIFDRAKRVAVVLVTRSEVEWRFRLKGKIGRAPDGRSAAAETYKKVGRKWRFVRAKVFEVS